MSEAFLLPDPLAATRALLMMDADLRLAITDKDAAGADRVNVYAEELPIEMASAKPRACVLIQSEQGPAGIGGYAELHEPSYNLYTMGQTPKEAMQIYLLAKRALKHARRQVVNGCLIHSYDLVGAPRAGRDPGTQWPFVLSTWKSLTSDKQAT